ncbi:MAG: aryl-sulfate sulfotransferase [Bacteroidetes bacterium]|nr:aryl-sulfate sulfotransferase [Bacteroidota bacterium]
MRIYTLIFVLWSVCFSAIGQERTIGLVTRDSTVDGGYYLFAPKNDRATYLVNDCGQFINKWTSEYQPGNIDYLLENGDLITARQYNQNPGLGAGGQGGILEQYDWDGNKKWSYVISDSIQLAHHDISILPNGNFLVLVWDKRFYQEAIDAGRDSNYVDESVWSEKIIEIKPIFPDSAEIVWEWYLWDHLIQDYDPTKDNYGVVADHPELLNINYILGSPDADWLHANSLDYDPESDQIIFSSRDINEIYVIDHSTTTEEAASHSGGRWDKGGDFLFRYGNPRVYERGDTSDQEFFMQHDANFVAHGLDDYGALMVFNNGRARFGIPIDSNYSQVVKIYPTRNADSSFVIDNQYAVDSTVVVYEGSPRPSFFAAFLSGATALKNDRYLISHGPKGEFFEIDESGEILWKYVIPVGLGGQPLTQGIDVDDLGTGIGARDNFFFRAVKYDADFPGFDGKDLSSNTYIELSPLQGLCGDIPVISGVIDLNYGDLTISPTLVTNNQLTIVFDNELLVDTYVLMNIKGQILAESSHLNRDTQFSIDLPNGLHSGLYLLQLKGQKKGVPFITNKKIIIP